MGRLKLVDTPLMKGLERMDEGDSCTLSIVLEQQVVDTRQQSPLYTQAAAFIDMEMSQGIN